MPSNRRIFINLAIVLLLGGFLIPTHSAHALWPFDYAINETIATFANFVMTWISEAIGWSARTLDRFVAYQTQSATFGIFVVDSGWRIVRDFVNMFFILILIVMAFGTVFDLKGYSYRDMLGPFLISALLVNFSLAIGQYIITFANGLSGVFLKSVGSVSVDFAQGMGLNTIKTASWVTSVSDATGSVAVNAVFGIIFLAVALVGFLSAALFSVARIFVLWFLLILSPIAWVGYAFPNLRSRTWGEWWKNFYCWCFFLPYYLFFLMFGVIFIRNKANLPLFAAEQGTTIGSLALNDFLFYSLSLVILLGGLAIARKMACASGTYVGGVFGKVEGWAKAGTGYNRWFGAKKYYEATKAGLEATAKRIGEEGLPGKGRFIYEGELAKKQRAAKAGEGMQRLFGFQRTFAEQKGFNERANKEYESIKQQYELGTLTDAQVQAGAQRFAVNTPQGFAYRKMLGDIGRLDANITHDTLRGLGNNQMAAVDFIKNASSKGKLSEVGSNDIRQMAAAQAQYGDLLTNVAARKELYKHIQANPKLAADLDYDQFRLGMELLGGRRMADGIAFSEKVAKVRPDLVASYNDAHRMPDDTGTRLDFMRGFITSPKEIGSMHVAVWRDADFQIALYEEVQQRWQNARNSNNPRGYYNYLTNLQDAIRESPGLITDKVDKQTIFDNITRALGAP